MSSSNMNVRVRILTCIIGFFICFASLANKGVSTFRLEDYSLNVVNDIVSLDNNCNIDKFVVNDIQYYMQLLPSSIVNYFLQNNGRIIVTDKFMDNASSTSMYQLFITGEDKDIILLIKPEHIEDSILHAFGNIYLMLDSSLSDNDSFDKIREKESLSMIGYYYSNNPFLYESNSEYFCVSFQMYLIDKDLNLGVLKRVAPETYNYFDNLCKTSI